MKNSLIFIFGILLFTGVFAQYPAGFIVTMDDDTIPGYIKPEGTVIWHKMEITDEPDKYLAKEVKSYTLGITEYKFHCFEVLEGTFPANKCAYLKKLNIGYISLYKFVGKDKYGELTLPNYYIHKPGYEMIRSKRSKFAFKREMKILVGDSEEILKDLKGNRYPPYKVKGLVDDYNEWKAMNDED